MVMSDAARNVFSYTVTSEKGYQQALEDVKTKVAEKGFRVLHVHDVTATLGEKGFTREPYAIVEFCNAKFAHAVLAADELIGLMMPCKINIYVKDGRTYLSALRPSAIAEFFPGSGVEKTAAEVERLVREMVDEAR